MDPETIASLGRAAVSAVLQPLQNERRLSSPVLGFDTEYTSKGHALLSFQLATEKKRGFYRASKLTIDALAGAIRHYVDPDCSHVILCAYFSIAELQHLPVVREAVDVSALGSSIDVDFYSRRHSLLITVFDLARFFYGQSLAKVAASFGLEKRTGIDTRKVTAASVRTAKFRDYAMHDARLCYDIASKLREGFAPEGVDPLYERTPASCASAAFRLKLSVAIDPPPSRVRLTAMRGCWGGRAEAAARGAFPTLYEYDLSSAYPRAAASFGVMPIGDSFSSFTRMSQTRKAVGGFARVRFEFPDDCLYPCLPVDTGKLQIYPLQGETFCTLDELRLAEELGAKVTVIEGWHYRRGTREFSDYMQSLIARRDASKNAVERVALKLLANSLIGKLAQRITSTNVADLIKAARAKGVNLNGQVKLSLEECRALGLPATPRLGSLFYPEWNGLITGRVRTMIGAAAVECNALYLATDAIWTERKRKPTARLGGVWNFTRSGPAVIARTRLGRISDHIAHHSVWSKAAGMKLLDKLEDGNENGVTYDIETPTRLKQSLRTGRRFGVWTEQSRRASSHWDDKRELCPDGRTRPWKTQVDAQTRYADSSARRSRGKSGANRKRGKRSE